jgi:osmotically-inducible protein OsmY
MRTDDQIASDVAEELRWSAEVKHLNITSTVDDGIVTLTGSVPGQSDKYLAECAAKRVAGVTAIANDIQVSAPTAKLRSDTLIAHDAIEAIRADLPRLAEHLQIVVRDGHLTLDGSVEWQWQRQRLESTVRAIEGVAVVENLLVIRPRVMADVIKRSIESAFRRSAEVDAARLTVEACDSEVILRGAVRSVYDKNEAQRTAWSAPGVTRVINEITVNP